VTLQPSRVLPKLILGFTVGVTTTRHHVSVSSFQFTPSIPRNQQVRSPMSLLGTMLKTLAHKSEQNAREGKGCFGDFGKKKKKDRLLWSKTKCDQILTRQRFFDKKAHLVACNLESHHFVRWFKPHVPSTSLTSLIICTLPSTFDRQTYIIHTHFSLDEKKNIYIYILRFN
jgi:hypothetical protein